MIIPSHVRHSSNKLVDILANAGMEMMEGDHKQQCPFATSAPLLFQCMAYVGKDLTSPNGVTNTHIGQHHRMILREVAHASMIMGGDVASREDREGAPYSLHLASTPNNI
jgi:hypothetical protein